MLIDLANKIVHVVSMNSLARALFPAVAVGGGGGPLQLAVVALVADAGALRAAAQRVSQPAGPALEDVLQRGRRKKSITHFNNTY